MTLRSYLHKLTSSGEMISINVPVSKTYEMSGILKKTEPRPVLFEQVKESHFRVMGNLFGSKDAFAGYFSLKARQIIPSLTCAIERHIPCPVITTAPSQEMVIEHPDLDELPILRHCALECIAGKVLVFPTGKGSTVGSYTLYRLKHNGHAPLAILNAECETITAVGCIIAEITCVDQLPIRVIQTGGLVKIDDNLVHFEALVKTSIHGDLK